MELLLISNNSSTIDYLQKILQGEGKKLTLCDSGRQAILILTKQEFTLVLIEIPLYDINVYDMLATINLQSNFRHIVILISPTKIDADEILCGYSLGVMEYFIKPIDLNILFLKIQSYCELVQHRKNPQQYTLKSVQELHTPESQKHLSQKNYDELEDSIKQLKAELKSTKQKLSETEKLLRKTEFKYKDIFENTIEGIFQTTIEGRYLQVNRSLARIYGYDSANEMLAVLNDIGKQLYVDPNQRQKFQEYLEEYDTLQGFESQIYRKDGSVIWIRENARAVRDSNGELLYYEGTIIDITKRKEAIETIIRTNDASNRFVPHQLLGLLGKSTIIELNLNDNIQKKMTIMYVDIRSFTALSEEMTAVDNFRFLNAFLSRTGPIIRENNGFIDKYIGDSIMALFNEAQDAYCASLGIFNKLKAYNSERNQAGYQSIQIGIGLNTGDVILGAIGEEHRIEGTVIGNTVNTASRIEQLTKKYNVPFLIGENTFHEMNHEAQQFCRFIDTTYVKGKSNQVTIYEVFTNDPLEIRQLKTETKSNFEKSRLLAVQGKKNEAFELLKICFQENQNDALARYFLQSD